MADECRVLRRDLAAAQQAADISAKALAAAEQSAKASGDALVTAQAELSKQRDQASGERKRLTQEIAQLQRQVKESSAVAETVRTERDAAVAARDSLLAERSRLTDELDRVRSESEDERDRLQSTIRQLGEAAAAAAKSPPQAAAEPKPVVGLNLHFKKPIDWDEPVFVHYWTDGRRSQWPGEPMTAEGDGWFFHAVADVESATVVFNDNRGHQTPDLGRNLAGWYDGTWHDEKPGKQPVRRKARSKEPA
ncbi:MAG: starch-binding protein [Rhodospirillales bacterium]